MNYEQSPWIPAPSYLGEKQHKIISLGQVSVNFQRADCIPRTLTISTTKQILGSETGLLKTLSFMQWRMLGSWRKFKEEEHEWFRGWEYDLCWMIKRIKMQNLARATYSALKEKAKLSAKALSPHEKYKFAYNLARVSTHNSADPFSGNVHHAKTPRRSGHLTVQPDSVRKNLSCGRRTDTLFPAVPTQNHHAKRSKNNVTRHSPKDCRPKSLLKIKSWRVQTHWRGRATPISTIVLMMEF